MEEHERRNQVKENTEEEGTVEGGGRGLYEGEMLK